MSLIIGSSSSTDLLILYTIPSEQCLKLKHFRCYSSCESTIQLLNPNCCNCAMKCTPHIEEISWMLALENRVVLCKCIHMIRRALILSNAHLKVMHSCSIICQILYFYGTFFSALNEIQHPTFIPLLNALSLTLDSVICRHIARKRILCHAPSLSFREVTMFVICTDHGTNRRSTSKGRFWILLQWTYN